MTDIKCVVCGEPWDAYGVRHGDMAQWEADLFRKGAGCPACEGTPPETGAWEPESILDIENGDEDPMIRLNAWEASQAGDVPKWEQPEPEVLWTCAGCGVQVQKDSEGELDYVVPPKALCRQWYHSHPFHSGAPETEPAHKFADDLPVCEFCLTYCDECGAPVSKVDLGDGDPYAPGWSAPSGDGHRTYCVECILCEDEDDCDDAEDCEDAD